MKFNVETNVLINALQVATKALPGRTPNSILEGIMIETDLAANEVILTCSDEHLTIVTRFPAYVTEFGRGVAPGKLFTDIIRHLESGDVEIACDNRFRFTIIGSGSRTSIAGQDADLFPLLPKLTDAKSVSLPQNILKNMIRKTEFAIAVEDMREVLTGAYLELENGVLSMVSLDGFRMAIKRDHSVSTDASMKAIIPGRALGDIGKLLADDEDAFCTLSVGNGKLHIDMGETELFVILIGGEYVNYRTILPKSFATECTVLLEPLRRSIERAALIAREDNNNLVVFNLENGELAIEAHTQIGDVYEKLQVEQDGLNIGIAFNVKYMIDVVRTIESESVVLKMNSPITPCIAAPASDEDYCHLVLPVRTGATVSGAKR